MALRSRIIAVALGAFVLMFAVDICLAGSPAEGDGAPAVKIAELKGRQQKSIAPKRSDSSILAQQIQSELEAIQRTMAEMKRLSERLKNHQRRLVGLNSKMSSMGEQNQMMQLQLQQAMNRQSQMMQTMSAIMKSMHDTQKSIINNMR